MRKWFRFLRGLGQVMPFDLSQVPAVTDLVADVGHFLDGLSFDTEGDRTAFSDLLWASLDRLSTRGWSDACLVDIYLSQLKSCPSLLGLNVLQEQADLVGSGLFVAMWQAEWTEVSSAKACHLLELALKTLGFEKALQPHQDFSVYVSGFADFAPDHVFWQQLAVVVQLAFPDGRLAEKGQLARQIHQLRYVISLQQTMWIRQHYGQVGQSDRQALVAYLAEQNLEDKVLERWGILPSDYAYDLRESARLHNKLAFTKAGLPIPSLHIPNVKILLHFHSELILDAKGKFANILDLSENGVVNGSSFNYASRNDYRHWELDILPTKEHDPCFRRRILRTPRYRYQSPMMKRKPILFWREHDWLWSYFNPLGGYMLKRM